MKEDKISKRELDNNIDTSKVMLKWNNDPVGYFTIKPLLSEKKVFVRCYGPDNKLRKTFSGITTLQIAQEIIERKLISRLGHAVYLGKEIEKAIIALKNNLNYTQDKELNFNVNTEKLFLVKEKKWGKKNALDR